MTNPDSVGPEPKEVNTSYPTSAFHPGPPDKCPICNPPHQTPGEAAGKVAQIVRRAMEFTEAHNRYAVAKKNAYEGRDKGRDSQMAIQILAQRRTAEMHHLFQECMTAKI